MQGDSRFFAIATDLVGAPTELLDECGGIAWRTRSTLWGTTTWNADASAYTPLRFPGQYADPETGLHYNFHRHYDPTTARYLSQDPLGLDPVPNPVTYVHNPHTWADPLGLAGCEPGIDDATYDAIDDAYGNRVASGVDHDSQRANDDSGNAPDHVISGIGSNPHDLAKYLHAREGNMTQVDTKAGAEVLYDAARKDAQGRGVLIVQTAYRIHAYHYAESDFKSGRYRVK